MVEVRPLHPIGPAVAFRARRSSARWAIEAHIGIPQPPSLPLPFFRLGHLQARLPISYLLLLLLLLLFPLPYLLPSRALRLLICSSLRSVRRNLCR
jgi:hypothetical protein